MANKVRVGIIGCGAFSPAQHFPNCMKNDRIEITYACDWNEERLRLVRKHFEIGKLTANAREVFEARDVDMVILAVPNNLHGEMISLAAAGGKHILCEKPMAMDIKEAYKIVKSVKKAGIKLCVDYNRRFSPSIIDMKKAYQEHRKNSVANPHWCIDIPSRSKLPEEEATMMIIRINDDSATYRPVHIDWSSGGGQIIGEGCHWLDLATWILEDEPVRVYATGWTRLSYIINIDYKSGARVCLFFSSNGTFDYPKELIEIMDRGALFRNECFVENQFFGLPGTMARTYPLQHDECREIGQEGGLSGYLEKLRHRREIYEDSGKKTWLNLSPDKGHYNLLDSFVGAILNDEPSPVNEMDGARATYLSLRAMESIRQGTSLPVNVEDYEFFVW